jgi:large subunit ribosomal protein L3
MHFILGKKLRMTQVWKGEKVVPVTVILAEPNKVSLVREKKRDGYEAVQVSGARAKHEFRSTRYAPLDISSAKVGDEINVGAFSEGDKVRITGISKGRGFQGVVKRHGFGGGPKTHGQKNRYRAPGSIGHTAAQRVVPGRRMAGRMGNDNITIKNLEVAGVDVEKNTIMLKGAVPGAPGGLIIIQRTKAKK